MRKVTEGYDGNILMKKKYILLKYIYICESCVCTMCIVLISSSKEYVNKSNMY